MTKFPIIKLQYKDIDGDLYLPINRIVGFGHLYGKRETGCSWISYTVADGDTHSNLSQMDQSVFVVRQTPEEIMTMIDKAQALVHALET